MVKAQPDQYSTVTAYLNVEGASQLIEFLTKVFGGTEQARIAGPDGTVMHAEVAIGDSVVMLSDVMPGMEPTRSLLNVYVDKVDATFQKAVDAGATVDRPVEDQFYGDRTGTVLDRWGNRWSISTHIEDVTEEEMAKRMAAMAQ